MHKVVTINLNGRAFQFDEPAFDLLRRYLDQAEANLKDSPDRAEILADLEQAIAEKCGRYLHAHKTVVNAAEIDQVLTEMGPVEAADTESTGEDTDRAAPKADVHDDSRPGPKRFYRIREGAMFAGICNGAAAYTNVDVLFVRIAVVILAIVSHGWALLGYWLLAFIIPEAYTADEHAAAHGQAPFNAQDVVDEARRSAASFAASANATGAEWRRHFRAQRRHWTSQARAWRRQWRAGAVPPPWTPGLPPIPPHRPAGLLWPVFGLLSLAGVALLLLAVLALVNGGPLDGWLFPLDLPVWAGILILAVLFHVVTSPIRAARLAPGYGWPHRPRVFAMWEGLFATSLMILALWLLFSHMPEVHSVRDFFQGLPEAIRGAAHEVAGWFRAAADALSDGV